ncbi:lipopolysaccharide biosynthesis protein [Eubacterium oxidoreducens]|uniref:Membrane protein involved in the export of O-antigen and teichoic acid n=1 Tax=Eubacterium oxidoreducens TaxID=1732 RepID=A0A1G6AEG1_EUBOX|nr:oligosaccharide flippase family protein [Eubacterium oxidoreducens]SDB06762.1 Membrane protein involved in the export of O-antigen and teichoic acid [Eubacterium oxidoreducens]
MNEKSRTHNSILNIMVGFGGYGLNLLLSFICRIIFTRTLTAEYLGVNGLFGDILTMLSLADLGIGTAIVYALYKPLADKNEDKIASLVQFFGKVYRIIGLVVAGIGLCLIPFLPALMNGSWTIPENLYVIYLIFLFNTASSYFFTYRTTLLTADQKNYLVVGVHYVFIIAQNIVQIILLIVTHNFLLYLLIQLIATLLYNFTISYIAKKQYPFIVGKKITPLPKEERMQIAKDTKSLLFYKLSGVLVNNTDNIIITSIRGLVQVGLLSNYTLFSGILNSMLGFVFNGLTASIGNFNAQESDERKLHLFHTINLANFWLFGWCAIGIAFVSSQLVHLCFGEDYMMNLAIPIILAFNFYMVGMQNAVLSFKTTLGLFKYGQYILIITALINIGLSLLLGHFWGVFGVLLATAISRAVTNTWYEPYAVFKHGLHVKPALYLKRYLFYLIILLISGGICYFLCSLVEITLLIDIIVKFIICSIVPNLVFWIFLHKQAEYKDGIGMLKHAVSLIGGKIKHILHRG